MPPLNLVGDFGGGGMLLAFGIVAALVERATSGKGQVVDAAMTDGSALLMNGLYPGMQSGGWKAERGSNMLDGGAHFYGSYETRDGKHVSIGSIEPQFYALLLEKLGLSDDASLPKQMSRDDWPRLQDRFTAIFLTKTRDEWDAIMLGSDICYAPILNFADAVEHPHNVERATFVTVNGLIQAAPAPRFSRTPATVPAAAAAPGEHTDAVLQAAGFDAARIAQLKAEGAVVAGNRT